MLLRTALILALTLSAESSSVVNQKQPWEWTVEERIAARTNPEARRQRVEEAEARREKGRGARVQTDQVRLPERGDDLDGGNHPELFLPTEVLGNFVWVAYGYGDDESATVIRESAGRAALRVGLPADFLSVFERETADIAPLHIEEVKLRGQLGHGGTSANPGVLERLQEIDAQQCRLHAAALKRLRATYGVSFDRFLYEHVAHNMSRSYIGVPPTGDELRRFEGGCQ